MGSIRDVIIVDSGEATLVEVPQSFFNNLLGASSTFEYSAELRIARPRPDGRPSVPCQPTVEFFQIRPGEGPAPDT